jgi:hypothetical protein
LVGVTSFYATNKKLTCSRSHSLLEETDGVPTDGDQHRKNQHEGCGPR